MINILTIAGSDSCGGAGIQADMKTIHSLGAHALTAVTAVTAQNSLGVAGSCPVPAPFITKQIETVVSDVPPGAVKIGMLGTVQAVLEVAGCIEGNRLKNIVLDPVLRSTTGGSLLDHEAVGALRDLLLPGVRVVTPNLHEAGVLLGRDVKSLREAEQAARDLHARGPDVVVTGGHLEGACVDVLCTREGVYRLPGERLDSQNTHGTGCVFSSALATFLAMDLDVLTAAERAGLFTREAIKRGYAAGKGAGVVNPLSGWGVSNRDECVKE